MERGEMKEEACKAWLAHQFYQLLIDLARFQHGGFGVAFGCLAADLEPGVPGHATFGNSSAWWSHVRGQSAAWGKTSFRQCFLGR
jgi:hypothetical protein